MMKQRESSVTHLLAKYWLETAVGVIAVLVLLVGIVVSEGGRRDSSEHAQEGSNEGDLPRAVAVLHGKPTASLDAVLFDSTKQSFHYSSGAQIRIPYGETLSLLGWAVARTSKSSPSSTFVQVDGFARGQASLNDRPDVAAALQNPAYSKSGFTFSLPPTLLTLGTHTLALLVEDASRSGYYVEPNWLKVVVVSRNGETSQATDTPNYSIDEVSVAGQQSPIVAGKPVVAVVRGHQIIQVAGWAVDASAGATAGGVSAVIDGVKVIPGTYGAQRPDVASAFHNDQLTPSGFVVIIPTVGLSAGKHYVSLRVLNNGGSGYSLIKDRIVVDVE
jgi:hypothetical protein